MAVVVTGLGLVSALGPTVRDTWNGLLAGRSAIALRQAFADLPPRPLAMIGKQPQELTTLLTRATAEALDDARLSGPLPDCGVVIGSSRGYQARWETAARTGEVAGWLESLPHMAAIAVARQVHSRGPLQAPMAACATGLWAIAQGSLLIRTGQCDRVMVGAGEAAVTPLTLTGFEQMRALAHRGCYPFDQRREGLVLGEGAAVLVLEDERLARSRSAPIYGRVLESGLTADAHHISAPDAAGQSGQQALHTCLTRSGLAPEEIGLIHAHGTGTRLNDAYEARLIQANFPKTAAVVSTKGALGHTLGASGAIGAAICLLSLRQGILPPSVGLAQPAFSLNLVRRATEQPIAAALCFSFGFGGQNAIAAFARA